MRERKIKFLEIGVSQGGSLDMWATYFGPNASIIGVDIDPACRRFESPQVEIVIGDQGDQDFLVELSRRIGKVDAILDDGGHRMDQQILTFQQLYGNVTEGGIYMCEDTHTSYDPTHGGGLGKPDTFIEYMKKNVDYLHSWYNGQANSMSVGQTTKSICFYDSIVVLEKQAFTGPCYVEVGRAR